MGNFKEGLDEIINRRQLNISIAKRSILLSKTEIQKNYLVCSSVLLIYANLEGGVKEISSLLLGHINRSKVNVGDLCGAYLNQAISGVCKFDMEIKDHEKQIAQALFVRECLQSKATLPGSVQTSGNLTPSIIKKVCRSLRIEYFLSSVQENNLNILLLSRNSLAHGDQGISLDMDRIDSFSGLVQCILADFAIRVLDVYETMSWLQ